MKMTIGVNSILIYGSTFFSLKLKIIRCSGTLRVSGRNILDFYWAHIASSNIRRERCSGCRRYRRLKVENSGIRWSKVRHTLVILENYLNEGEYRIPLWFTLDNEERISLVKNQPDREEACFMFMLLMEEFKDEDSMLNWISTELE